MKVLALLILAAVALETRAQKIRIDILYESLCPDSLNFIKHQLYPAYDSIAAYVDINFIPFGKSASVSKSQFVCQHGPRECMGNKLQSCALQNLKDQTAQVEYVNCFMSTFMKSKRNNHELGQSCVSRVGLPWEHVNQCYESSLGTQLQLQAELDTLNVKPRFIPTIMFNGVFNQRAQDDSQVNFKSVACSYIRQLHPDAC